MDSTCILPGQPLTLTTDSASHRNTYGSRVLRVGEDWLAIAIPSLKGLDVSLPAGVGLKVCIETASGACQFQSAIIGHESTRGIAMIRLPQKFQQQEDGSLTPAECRFTAVTSGKGGVGKTSFILNHAIALAERGQRVLLFDADLGMANIDVLLKTSTRTSIVDVIEGSRNMHEVIVHTDYGFDLIAGGSGMARLASLTPGQMQRITDGFAWLSSHYDQVLIDTGAGLSKNVTAFVLAADETIVVTTPEPHAITDAYSIIKVILEENRHVRLKLLINKCESGAEGEAVTKRLTHVIRSFLDYAIQPLGCLPESKTVGRSIREQVPFMASRPDSDVARALRAIAAAECPHASVHARKGQGSGKENLPGQDVGAKEKRPAESSFAGRFMRLFRIA